MKKLLLLFALCVVGAQAQIYYTASKTTTLAAASEAITVQQIATGGQVIRFVSAYVDSSSSCAITVERDGTAATSTTLTVANVNPSEGAGTSTAWSASNVGSGTVITRATVGTGGSIVIDLSKVRIALQGTQRNLTVRTGTCTGTVNIVIMFTESSS